MSISITSDAALASLSSLATVFAPKAEPRSSDAIIMEAVEAYRDDLDRGHRPWAVAAVAVIYGHATPAQRGAITRKLNAIGFSDDYADAKGRFLGFVGHCATGSDENPLTMNATCTMM